MEKPYIKKLTVSGDGKSDSVVEFSKGLNIVCGASDTGKSYIVECFDFLFGSSETRFDANTGYTRIKITVAAHDGDIHLLRELGSKYISVISESSLVQSDEYSISPKSKKFLNSVWLALFGINEKHFVIKNADYERAQLTWRSILHMFLIKETEVFNERSILLPEQNTARTLVKTALYYFITGKDLRELVSNDSKEIALKEDAKAEYISERLAILGKRQKELEVLSEKESNDPEVEIASLVGELSKTEQIVMTAINRNKQLIQELSGVNERLTECSSLVERYQELRSLYVTDIQRLTFIIDGETNLHDIQNMAHCPLCEGELHKETQESLIEAARVDLEKIQLQLVDLNDAENSLLLEKSELEDLSASLSSEKFDVESLINNELKPKADALKNSLNKYRNEIEVRSEIALLEELLGEYRDDYYETRILDDKEPPKFKVSSLYNKDLIDGIGTIAKGLLEKCNYDKYESTYFDLEKFDLVLNNKAKETFGKGYRAFFNTVLALTIRKLLAKEGKYSPNMLIIDSPILSLREKTNDVESLFEIESDDMAPDTMKAALFQYMIDNQTEGQVILIENDIPELDYKNVKIQRFTKDENQGRYGLLDGVR
jgi:hypothetical protein